MTLDLAIFTLEANAECIKASLAPVAQEQSRWKPDETQWSMLEVINHLYDEEHLDFRKRLKATLDDPTKPWEPIDPQVWVVERRYNDRELLSSVNNFLAERQISLEWLRSLNQPGSLNQPDLEIRASHLKNRSFKVKDLLASWLAHDLLHIRQLTRLKYQYLAKDYTIDYAGNW